MPLITGGFSTLPVPSVRGGPNNSSSSLGFPRGRLLGKYLGDCRPSPGVISGRTVFFFFQKVGVMTTQLSCGLRSKHVRGVAVDLGHRAPRGGVSAVLSPAWCLPDQVVPSFLPLAWLWALCGFICRFRWRVFLFRSFGHASLRSLDAVPRGNAAGGGCVDAPGRHYIWP